MRPQGAIRETSGPYLHLLTNIRQPHHNSTLLSVSNNWQTILFQNAAFFGSFCGGRRLRVWQKWAAQTQISLPVNLPDGQRRAIPTGRQTLKMRAKTRVAGRLAGQNVELRRPAAEEAETTADVRQKSPNWFCRRPPKPTWGCDRILGATANLIVAMPALAFQPFKNASVQTACWYGTLQYS